MASVLFTSLSLTSKGSCSGVPCPRPTAPSRSLHRRRGATGLESKWLQTSQDPSPLNCAAVEGVSAIGANMASSSRIRNASKHPIPASSLSTVTPDRARFRVTMWGLAKGARVAAHWRPRKRLVAPPTKATRVGA